MGERTEEIIQGTPERLYYLFFIEETSKAMNLSYKGQPRGWGRGNPFPKKLKKNLPIKQDQKKAIITK